MERLQHQSVAAQGDDDVGLGVEADPYCLSRRALASRAVGVLAQTKAGAGGEGRTAIWVSAMPRVQESYYSRRRRGCDKIASQKKPRGRNAMELVPLADGFGVEVRGVSLLDVAIDAQAYKKVRDAFEKHSLLVFRDQQIADDIQVAYSRAFGPLELTKARPWARTASIRV